MMGSGKTSVGAKLAAELNLPFLDLDHELEKKERRSITQLFEQEGEAYFRAAEQQMLQNLSNDVCVVACGGGLPCFFNNMELLKEKGIVIYLDAKPELLYQRIKGDELRPKLQDFEAFLRLKAEREESYRKAHLMLDANQSIEQIVAEVLSLRAAGINQ
jgi:shikimate kinase